METPNEDTPRAKKATKIETHERFKQIAELLRKGKSSRNIVEYCVATYGLSESGSWRLLGSYFNVLSESFAKTRSYEAVLILEKNNDLFEIAYQAGRFHECRVLLDQRIRLLGLDKIPPDTGTAIASAPSVMIEGEAPAQSPSEPQKLKSDGQESENG